MKMLDYHKMIYLFDNHLAFAKERTIKIHIRLICNIGQSFIRIAQLCSIADSSFFFLAFACMKAAPLAKLNSQLPPLVGVVGKNLASEVKLFFTVLQL
ncbi:hypothetical protein T11_9706 [Trichinella zimbabwensis]|uniref:Uncharacterized protein n=1 Tax=Trichinella zimbabwensis TaxID=268475 RepID=A0A0V1HRA5_9BILA|nr:hypothetical protein T11_9706 [Trichinella zimbabwensis]